MTARSLAIAAGMAVVAMGNLGHAGAEEFLTAPTPVGATLVSDPWAAAMPEPNVRILLHEPVDIGDDLGQSTTPWSAARFGADSGPVQVDAINLTKRDGKDGADNGPFFTYAGVGLGKVKFSLDADGDIKLAKEKQYKRTQLFLGMRYKFLPSSSLALEYRVVTGRDPIFESDTGIAAIGSSSKLNNHNLLMNLRFGF